jgi:aspartate aminotransferase
LEEKTDIDAYDRNRKALYDGLTQLGFDCVYPAGAFYLWVKSPTPDDKEFSNRAKKYNILFVPGSSFACPGYVRIAYCVSHDMIIRSLPAFKKLSEEYGLTK